MIARIVVPALLLLAPALLQPAEEYALGPDSQPQAGVPKGAVSRRSWSTSRIFPGTTREYWVYVPAQYKADKPAPVMVVFDGGGFVTGEGRWRAPIVFDNLIDKGQMPPAIGIFINPGVAPALTADQQPRFNRSFEYDALGDRNARFLIEEILPEVGKEYNLSKDPNDRGVAGSSSGGIAAFTVAWTHPEAFRRVISFVGSYTNLRGGEIYSSHIRKTEPKPLRVFLQDGRNDQNIYSGNWFIANQDMASALAYAGYDSTFVIGNEGHNNKHGSAILPDALRWLWRDYPKPIAKPTTIGERQYVGMILEPGKEWEMVSQGHKFTEGPAVDRQGSVYFTDIPNNRIHKISTDGKVTVFKEDTGGANGLMFGPDGRLYACQNRRKRIVAYTPDGAESVITEGVGSNDLAINSRGEIYFTDPGGKTVWFIDRNGARRPVVQEGITFPNGVRLSPDYALLSVADYASKWVWSFQVQPDGSLANGQPFHRLETEDDAAVGPDGMTVDSEGQLYVATRIGVQVCDQAGRVVAIIGKPQPGALSNAVFGGPGLQMLYVTAGDKVFRRQLRRKGVFPWTPVKPPAPRM
ncbi:MAG TPA: SMP-30/gluconolactonase/LRE family protein [Bryobacteraceae bacterium]|nr:SMP-30/gluconolactonase/LRE family protein [Bryobacteraceae bacterium]